MPPVRTRSWNAVLDNLGENLIRLGTSLAALSENPTAPTNDATFAQAMEKAATGFRLAFRQARPALAAGQNAFLQLSRASIEELAASHTISSTEEIGRAHTLVHEGVLVCQEMVALLNLIEQGSQTDPDRTRRAFSPSLLHLAEVTASSGWDLRGVCHEYEAEVRLAESSGATVKDLVPASMGLLHEMANAAEGLRQARREWFRVGQRLATALGTDSLSPTNQVQEG